MVLIDIICYICGAIALVVPPWRTPFVIMSFIKATSGSDINWDRRGAAWMQMWIGLFDVVTVPVGVLVLCSVVRTYPLIAELRKASREASEDRDLFYNSDYRFVVWQQFAIMFLDFATLPVSLIVLFSWRAGELFEVLGNQKWKTLRKKQEIFLILLSIFADIPFLIAGLLCICLLIRAPLFIKMVARPPDSSGNRIDRIRKKAFKYLGKSLVDLPFILGAFFVTVTLYRFPAMVLKFVAMLHPPRTGKALLQVEKVRFTFPEKGGFVFSVVAQKPADFVPTRLTMFVLGRDFWNGVAGGFGGTVASVAEATFPLNTNTYIDLKAFAPASSNVAFDFSVTDNLKKKVIVKSLSKILRFGGSNFEMQLEYEAGILIFLKLPLQLLLELAESGDFKEIEFPSDIQPSNTPQREDAKEYPEILRKCVTEQLLLIGRDIVAFLCLLRVIFLSPWRIADLFVRLYESPEHFKSRNVVQIMKVAKRYESLLPTVFARLSDHFHKSLKFGAFRLDSEQCTTEIQEMWTHLEKIADFDQALAEKVSECRASWNSYLDVYQQQYGVAQKSLTELSPDQALSVTTAAFHPFFASELETTLSGKIHEMLHAPVSVPSFWTTASSKHRSYSEKCGIAMKCHVEASKDSLAAFFGVLVFVTIVRMPVLLLNLKKEKIDKRRVCFEQAFELLLDIGYFLESLAVFALVTHAPALVVDALTAVYVERGVSEARDVIHSRFQSSLDDWWEILSLVTMWKTYKYFVAVCVWGFLTPADNIAALLLTFGLRSKFFRRSVAVLCWIVMLVIPVIFFKKNRHRGGQYSSAFNNRSLCRIFVIIRCSCCQICWETARSHHHLEPSV
eukprot:TRINITY_DN7618_c0_g1_i1.p1 TRINITY_DN7618_c0_g1~~TRINITY_DN7618_c0_g1_i1.p1  ORF type:complete len:909 (+),score=253.56 TRINITY_DN7618_c0_g1_i1:195-2729(+)